MMNVWGCVEGIASAGSLYVVIAVCTEAVNCMTCVAVKMDNILQDAFFHLGLAVTLTLANHFTSDLQLCIH